MGGSYPRDAQDIGVPVHHSCRGFASHYSLKFIAVWLVSLAAIGCGNSVTLPDGDVVDLDGVNLNDIDLDGVDVDQDTLSKLDIKSDTISSDVDASGTDASGTDASGTDAADTADIASGCTSTAACNDGNPCTDDTCGANGVCAHANNTATCDDGNICTTGDACKDSTCLPGTATSCTDNNPCTDDSCDKATGCVHLANAATCDDGIACTMADTCTATACKGFANFAYCNDDNACTKDSCDVAAGGCVNANTTSECTDENPCTTGDMCTNGACIGAAMDCNDNNICTDDSCNSDTGACVNLANAATCDDGNICTIGDYCNGEGTCVGDGTLNCDDQNACTADSCNSGINTKVISLGCVHTNLIESPCSDGNACTYGDFCANGACLAGDPTNCNDDNKCTDDSCNPDTGACVNLANAVTCDDGNACTLADTCTQTVCEGTPNTCDQGPYNNTTCSTMICDYTDGLCKSNNGVLWNGTFATSSGWKLQGEWQIGLAAASTDQTFGYPDPGEDYDGDGHLAGTVIGGNISNTPHDWYYLTSPAIDLSAQATSTYLYSNPTATSWTQYDQSLILSFSWFAGLSAAGGQYLIVQCSGDGTNWTTLADGAKEYNYPNWQGTYSLVTTGYDIYIPKEALTKHFQFRIGYKVTAVEAIVPLVSGLTIDAPQIGIGSCWD